LKKSNSRVIAVLAMVGVAFATLPPVEAAVVKVGGACKPVGAKGTAANGSKLTCTKVGSKLVWRAPAPTKKPTIVPSASAAPVQPSAAPAATIDPISGTSSTIVNAALKEGKVTWYIAIPITAGRCIADQFQKQYPGMSATVERYPGTTVYDRFMAENNAGKPNADVLQGTDVPIWKSVFATGMVINHKPPTDKLFTNAYRIGNFAYSQHSTDTIVLINPKKVSDAEKAILAKGDWKDYIDPRWKGRIATVAPDLGGSRYSPWMYAFEKFGKDYVAKFGALKPKIYADANQAAEAIARGEQDILFPFFEGGAATLYLNGASLQWYFPRPSIAFGTTFTAISSMAPRPNAAILYQNWLLSMAGAKAYQDCYGVVPAIAGYKDARAFVTQPWYNPPVPGWVPTYSLWLPRMKRDIKMWHQLIKP